jgi:membrane protein
MGSYTETYGAIGAVMILLLWFYISGLVILMGAEMNAEIEHASPYGKTEGEKVPGERRTIGHAAMRAWRDNAASPSTPLTPPTPPTSPTLARPAPRALPAPAPGGFSSWMIGAGVVAAQAWMAAKALRKRNLGA